MTDIQVVITLVVFAGVVLAIAFDVLDLALAAMLGASALIVSGILTQ